MKIAMLGHKWIPSREGGIEVVVTELAVRLVEQGHSVTCYNRGGRRTVNREYRGVRLKKAPAIPLKGISAMTASVSGALRAAFGRYDLVHFHAEGPSFMCWLPKLAGKKIVVTIHGLDHRRAKWGRLASAYILAGEKNAVRYADAIIVLNGETQTYFRETYGRETCLISNGVERPIPRKADQIRQLGLEKDRYLLFLSRIVPEKGLRRLIAAFRQVQTDKKLVIAGGASDTEPFLREMRALARGDDRIVFTGFVRGQLLEELYSNTYLYCLPSDLEGMPLTLLEAMSYGCCCLVSDIAECTQVVEDKGVVFQREDPEDLVRQLQRLCDHSQVVEDYRRQAADFICSRYSWKDMVEHTLKLYQSL